MPAKQGRSRVTGSDSRRLRLQLTAKLAELRDRLDRAVAEARSRRELIEQAISEKTTGCRASGRPFGKRLFA